ncbi:MAG TPA: hypothetical protein VGW57_13505 [Chthoniobacterales bacterium]|nr:hypothetical protein [Chthoniobacterales bacterium]
MDQGWQRPGRGHDDHYPKEQVREAARPFPLLITLAQKARGAQAHGRLVDHLDYSFLDDRTGRLDKKRRDHEADHDERAGKTELIDTEERALKLSDHALDRDFLAGPTEATANFPSSFETYFLHAKNRRAPANALKYFMRLGRIGASYGLFAASFAP